MRIEVKAGLTFGAALVLASILAASAVADEAADAERRSYAAHLAAADAALRLGEPAGVRRWLDGAPERLRGFEWSLLAAQADQSTATLDLGIGELMSAAACADGKSLAVTSTLGKTAVIDAASWRVSRVLEGHKGQVFRAEFDARGERLLTAGQDGTVRVWDLATGAERLVFAKHGHPVGAARFLPDGRVASCSWDFVPETRIAGIVHVWDSATGAIAWTSRGGVKPLVQVRVLPGGKRVAAASWDFCAFVWDVGAAGEPRRLPIPDEGVYNRANDLAASPDGQFLAVTSSDRTARVFALESGALVATLRDHGEEVWAATFSPDGLVLATGGADGAVRLFDTTAWKPLATMRGHSRAVASLAYLPDGRLASAGADGTLRVWDAPPERYGGARLRHGGPCYSSQLSPDGRRLATLGEDGTVRLWDASTMAPIGSFHAHDRTGVHVAFSPNGGTIVTTSWDGTALLWDAESHERLGAFKLGAGVAHADFSRDGRFVACATTKGKSAVFLTSDGSKAADLDVGDRGASQVRFHGDGAELAVACRDGAVRVFSTADWSTTATIASHRGAVESVDWVGAGPRLVSSGADGAVRLSDSAAGADVRLLAMTDDRPGHLRVSPDGKRVAVCAAGVLIVDAVHGGVLHRARVLSDQPYEVAWSPDGTRIYATDCPGNCVVLDTRPLREVLADERAHAAKSATPK